MTKEEATQIFIWWAVDFAACGNYADFTFWMDIAIAINSTRSSGLPKEITSELLKLVTNRSEMTNEFINSLADCEETRQLLVRRRLEAKKLKAYLTKRFG